VIDISALVRTGHGSMTNTNITVPAAERDDPRPTPGGHLVNNLHIASAM
jgi:hypothetical protein